MNDSTAESSVAVRIVQRRDYQFDNEFGPGIPALLADEPPPLGQAVGPAPTQMLGAAVGNCLASSLLFALRKYRQQAEPMRCEVSVETGRNPQGRLRVSAIHASIMLGVPAASIEHLDRALSQFEDFCTVTGSVRSAIPVTVEVFDVQGSKLK